ncbi:MAG: DUF1501 domain-containing protein [Planctomycetes bacterium]|jgi:uncharacterized protein (DUF1501 family)|nr:DUF1501 domain-containing protein [Planctomycetota bacterium]
MLSTRRDFLRTALGTSTLLSLGSLDPDWLARSALAAPRGERDTVLVVLQLTGGNDGLNTVVPYADDEYGRNRTTLRLPTSDLHKIDAHLGFHPRMAAFLRLYRDGYLSIVQGVGCPNPDQDHDRALRMWHTADPQRLHRQTGWLGRTVDRAWNPAAPETTAVFVGPIARPFALNAENVFVPSLRSAEDLTVRSVPVRAYPETPEGVTPTAKADAPLLQALRESTRIARTKSEQIKAAIASAGGSSDYPSFGLARDLHTIAQLIRADIGIRIFFAELGGGGIGGFDNHANQLGNHCALLHQMAESIAAFVYDLQRDRQLDRVLLMTFSEFGRTVQENGRRGTDHGAAAPVFLAGGKIKGGLLGSHPSLTDLDKGALKLHIDFRRVYATVLDRWLGCDSVPVLGSRFEPLDVL